MFLIQIPTPTAAIAAEIPALVRIKIFTRRVLQLHFATHPFQAPSIIPLVPIALSLGHVWMGFGALKISAMFASIFFVARTVIFLGFLGAGFGFGLGTPRRQRGA